MRFHNKQWTPTLLGTWEWRDMWWFHYSVSSWVTSYATSFFVHSSNFYLSSHTSRNCRDHGTNVLHCTQGQGENEEARSSRSRIQNQTANNQTANNNLQNYTYGNYYRVGYHRVDSSPAPTWFSSIQWLKANCAKIPACMNSCCSSEFNNLRPTTTSQRKRAILYRFGYVIAWGLSWIPVLLFATERVNGVAIDIIYSIFLPLQGVFNFIAYMHFKVISAKKGPAITWRQAFLRVYMSRCP